MRLAVVALGLSLPAMASCARNQAPRETDAGSKLEVAAPAASVRPAPSAAAPTRPVDASAAAASPSSTSSRTVASPGSDFDDLFAYGAYDAGVGDPAKLTRDAGFHAYVNARFGFSVDVPNGLTAMPEPDNGDGMQWRLGHLVAMSASGMINVIELRPACARSPNVTAHKETATSCWATGKRDGFIFWERFVVSNEVMYSVRLQYAESLKATMDPIVSRVNASWKY